MRHWVAALCCAAIGCGGGGRNLPSNVGANHNDDAERASAHERAEASSLEPEEIGTYVWANFHDAGFFFHGVVVEREGALHRVVYDDGENEWLAASALRPDALGEGAEINVRRNYGGRFTAATIERRVGRAVYLHHNNGDESWSSIVQVRFQSTDVGAPTSTGVARADSSADEIGSHVLVDNQGSRYAATVTARREDAFRHVVFVDGDTEWVGPEAVTVDDVREGSVVRVRRSWDPPQWLQARVDRRVGDALHVTFEDGGTAWTSMFRARVAPIVEPAPVVSAQK